MAATACGVYWCMVTMALAAPPGLVINEDNSHFFGSRSADEMTLEGLHAFVDQYANTKVSHLFLCPNAMRVNYRSDIWDAIWDVGDQRVPEDNPFARKWVDNARLLCERDLDPYRIWIDRCRQKGISPWLSSRMNDVHDVSDPTNFMHSLFWRDHPEYWRVPGSTGAWVDRALNFGLPEVREHHRKLIRELLERYDVDGIELDWMRFGYHFKPGEEEQGAAILTEYMREMRALTKEWSAKRGHPVKLGARVPAHPDAARGLGMDGVTWAREGLLDMLVVTPFWATSDFDIPMELWRERIGPAAAQLVLAAGQEVLLRAYPSAGAMENDIESARGFAAGAFHRGADQIYLFNYMDKAPMRGGSEGEYRALLEEGLDLGVVTTKPRRHVVTYRDTVPPGMSDNAQLPAAGYSGRVFRIYIGPAPQEGAATFLAGLAAGDGVGAATFDVDVNGAACSLAADHAQPGQFPGVARAVQFLCLIPALRDGYNDVHIMQQPGQPEQQIVWAEIRIDPRK